MAELMLGQPLFPGESGIDQLVEIIKVLGTPSREQIKTMNPNYMEHKFPQIKPHPFSKVGTVVISGMEMSTFYFHRCSDHAQHQRQLTWSQSCWNILRKFDCVPSKRWCTRSLMNCELREPRCRTGRSFRRYLTSRGKVCGQTMLVIPFS